jgi:hypothetical protein
VHTLESWTPTKVPAYVHGPHLITHTAREARHSRHLDRHSAVHDLAMALEGSMILDTMICVRLRAYPYWYEDKNGSPCRSGGRKVFTILSRSCTHSNTLVYDRATL